jgi:hypothetical protein
MDMAPGVGWKRGGSVGLGAVTEVGDDMADSRWNDSVSADSGMDLVRFGGRANVVAEGLLRRWGGGGNVGTTMSENRRTCSPGRGDATNDGPLPESRLLFFLPLSGWLSSGMTNWIGEGETSGDAFVGLALGGSTQILWPFLAGDLFVRWGVVWLIKAKGAGGPRVASEPPNPAALPALSGPLPTESRLTRRPSQFKRML